MPAAEPRITVDDEIEREFRGASALATACILNLGYLNEQIGAFGRSLVKRHGLPTSAAFNVLTILHGADQPLLPSTIADRMIVSRPTVTGVLGTLERRGLIRRLPHSSDRRMTPIELTPAGREIVERLLPELHRAERQWLSCLTAEEQTTLLGLVGALQANALTPVDQEP